MTITETVKHAVGLDEPSGSATREEMSAAKLPLAYRDSCAGFLIKLNECRKKNYYWPGSCDHEMHTYEKCQYAEFQRRVEKQKELREQNGGARSN